MKQDKKPKKQATLGSLFKKSEKRKSSNQDAAGSSKQESEPVKKQKVGKEEKENKIPDVVEIDETTTSETSNKKIKKTVERCHQCRQVLQEDETKMFEGDPTDAVEEFLMLVDPKLSLLSGDEEQHANLEERPQHKLTDFSVYDKFGHLCPFDAGLIEKNIELFISGYVKPVYDESPGKEGGVCTKRMGPINEWWVTGFDGGESALIGFSTAFAEYILMEPSDDYAPFMNAVSEKICMSKIVIEFVLSSTESSYEELLNKVETTVPPENCSKLTEDSLLRHAQFLVEQVESFDSAADEDEEREPLIASACMRDLIKLAGVTLGKRRELRGVKLKNKVKTALGPTLATTTPLVQYVFDTFFKDQLDTKDQQDTKRKKRCGVCEVCQQPDCGNCRNCKDMVKFGGTGKSKQCCQNRRCPNLAVAEAEENENGEGTEDEGEGQEDGKLGSPKMSRRPQANEKIHKTKLRWPEEAYMEKKKKSYHKSVIINEEQFDVGDYVKVCPENPSDPLYICRIAYMWEDLNGKKMFHAQWCYRSSETVLGETGDPTEIFLCDDCDITPLGSIMAKCKVNQREFTEAWKMAGASEDIDCEKTEDTSDTLHLQKWYDIEEGTFLDIPKEFHINSYDEDRFCACCRRETDRQMFLTPRGFDQICDDDDDDQSAGDKAQVRYKKVLYKGEEFSVGDCVYVHPDAYKYKKKAKEIAKVKPRGSMSSIDEEKYPELYRKSNEYIKGSNVNISEPYRIGCILDIFQSTGKFGDQKEILLRVRKFYRPENTHKGLIGTVTSDLNMLYWCEEEAKLGFDYIEGKCYVTYVDEPDINVDEYTREGPHRFYFRESYHAESEEFDLPPNKARQELSAGKSSKGKGKGKARKACLSKDHTLITDHPVYEQVQKLRTLDIFAGCGGLSEGLHEVGVADSRWAIEFEPSAAQAYRLNNPGAVVFNADCNNILRMIMQGRETDDSGQRLPRKGEVDLLCGGPPCQGFSGMNRFNSREYSMFKNSLVASYLSYCDYFRPKFFILENVRNFVSFKKCLVLKLIMKTLVKLGYQCEFAVLQAGSYGVPQTRRRAILIAAAPGEILPSYPEPQHVFAAKGLSLSVTIDNKKYQALKKLDSAPYRTITVRDAMSDLPKIKNGANKLEIGYDNEPLSHFQKMVRRLHLQQVLRDHVCKDMSALVEARMSHIPTKPGSDWRDLPNICVKLRDGSSSKKLLYLHDDKKQGRNSLDEPRGVCACAKGKGEKCDPADRQFGTLIPWCLPHTSNRHNHWAGLYGRLEWDGFFSTTVTNPEPMGKQGRVLHPEQNRVVSVRECARSQGFPDSFRFYGNILDKHRQIGNAVAPPMAAAIGQEIRKCIVMKAKMDAEEEEDEEGKREEDDDEKVAAEPMEEEKPEQ